MAEIPSISNPLDINILDIRLLKYDGSEYISLLSQFVEISIYQSIFSPLMKATITIADFIGLYSFFPLIGEEIIEFSFAPTRASEQEDPYQDRFTRGQNNVLRFFISEARNIQLDDKGRGAAYVLELHSEEMLENGRTRVQRPFYGRYSDLIPGIVKEDLISKKSVYGLTGDGTPEKTKGVQLGNVPNMRPIDTIKWYTKRSVSDTQDNNLFVFFERFEGFYFNTIEQMIKKAKELKASRKTYYYISAYTQAALSRENPGLDHYSISAMQINKRFSTYEKLVGGYFENEYQEIDISNFTVTKTRSNLETSPVNSLGSGLYNTPFFINKMQNPTGDKTSKTSRIRYVITQNGSDNNTPSNQNYFRDKFGSALRTQVAFSQVSITISVPGDTRIQAGDVIDISIPDNHGFDIIKDDKYISGSFLIADIKHLIVAGSKHVMVMNLHKNAYLNNIETKSLYNTTPGTGSVLDPVRNIVTETATNNLQPYQRSPNNR